MQIPSRNCVASNVSDSCTWINTVRYNEELPPVMFQIFCQSLFRNLSPQYCCSNVPSQQFVSIPIQGVLIVVSVDKPETRSKNQQLSENSMRKQVLHTKVENLSHKTQLIVPRAYQGVNRYWFHSWVTSTATFMAHLF